MKHFLKFTIASGLFLIILVQLEAQTIPVKEGIKIIEASHQHKFFYRYSWIENLKVEKTDSEKGLENFLDKAFANTDVDYALYQDYYIILFPRIRIDENAELERSTEKKTYILNGKVTDGNSGETLPGSTIYIPELSLGTTTDLNGSFTLTIPKGVYSLNISSVGKSSENRKINIAENQTLEIELFELSTELNEVVIKGEPNRNVASVEMSTLKLGTKELSLLPKFMGETDILKSITLLPGVSTVGEGSSGFNVRGGNVDQNLVLLDDVPVFNTSHLFGFISSFNPDLVKGVTLYKAGIPAQFGGRASSVLDVQLRENESKGVSAQGGIGILSSKLLIEAPIYKDKTSFIAGARYGYPDWIIKKIPDKNVKNSSASFYDANLSIKHAFNKNTSIHYSGYYSNDDFKLAGDTLYNYSTLNSSLKLKSLLSKQIFFSLGGYYTDYSYSINGLTPTQNFDSKFGIQTISGKIDFTVFAIPKNKIDVGFITNHYTFNPGNLVPGDDSSLNPIYLQEERAIESAAYLSDEFNISSSLTLQAGLRYSHYSKLGPYSTLVYQDGLPKSNQTVIDTIYSGRNEKIRSYWALEPRLSFKFSLPNNNSIKLSYNRSAQYIHLISNTTAISPLDIWKSSDFNIAPQLGDQFAAGYFQNFRNNSIETTFEIYYKEISSILEYSDGAELFLNPSIETEILPAHGRMYGAELLVKKNSGKLTGWISYAYSRSLRKVDGPSQQERLNRGEYFPSNFDRPHNLSIVLNQKITRRVSLSTNFVFTSGRPITYPESVYIVDGYAVTQYSDRNQGRINSYHRLDISLNIDEPLKKAKKWKGSWSFSLYNVYARKNQYSVFFKPTYSGKNPQSYQLSVLGTVLPSITYNFKIGS